MDMMSATLIPLDKYLNTTYRPDCDYIDGEVRERNVGMRPHSEMLGALVAIFNNKRRAWGVTALPSVRVQTSASRVLVPDVTVVRRIGPAEPVIQTPPLVCCEILSPLDSFHDLQERVDEFLRMGVEHIWLVDPDSRHTYTATSAGFQHHVSGQFTVPGTPIRISVAEIFAEFDEMPAQC